MFSLDLNVKSDSSCFQSVISFVELAVPELAASIADKATKKSHLFQTLIRIFFLNGTTFLRRNYQFQEVLCVTSLFDTIFFHKTWSDQTSLTRSVAFHNLGLTKLQMLTVGQESFKTAVLKLGVATLCRVADFQKRVAKVYLKQLNCAFCKFFLLFNTNCLYS